MSARTPLDVLVAIQTRLNASRTRSIDLFRKIDTGGDGEVSFNELRVGLKTFGFECTDSDFRMLTAHLDKDGSGDVSIKELDRALKIAEKERSALPPPIEAQERCLGCGWIFEPDSIYCRKCGEKRPPRQKIARIADTTQAADNRSALTGTRGAQFLKKRQARTALGYVPKQPEEPGPMDRADEVLCTIKRDLNKRKTRMIDVFHVLDNSGDGILSAAEFRAGLGKLGFQPSDEDFTAVVQSLDKDASGDVSIQEFDKALRLAEKKAKAAGREADLQSWTMRSFDQFAHTTYDWGRRSVRMDHKPSETIKVGETTQMMSTSTVRSILNPDMKLDAYAKSWSSASRGPLESVLSNKVGHGSLEDSSITRQRLFDGSIVPQSWTPRILPPTLERLVLPPTHKVEGRFGYEPTNLPSTQLLKNRLSCATSLRNSLQAALLGGTKKFPNCPTMQSSVDQVVFNRDMDFSGDDMFDEDFAAMFNGAAGMPSWH